MTCAMIWNRVQHDGLLSKYFQETLGEAEHLFPGELITQVKKKTLEPRARKPDLSKLSLFVEDEKEQMVAEESEDPNEETNVEESEVTEDDYTTQYFDNGEDFGMGGDEDDGEPCF